MKYLQTVTSYKHVKGSYDVIHTPNVTHVYFHHPHNVFDEVEFMLVYCRPLSSAKEKVFILFTYFKFDVMFCVDEKINSCIVKIDVL